MDSENKTCKTTKEYRDKVKAYEEKMKKERPQQYKQRLEYHKNYYRKMKEAYTKMQNEIFHQNTHEIIMDQKISYSFYKICDFIKKV